MLNDAGHVAECTGDNIFVLKRGGIFTPPISAGALRGITREGVFEIAKEFDMPVSEPDLTRYDIYTADECFLTGTAAEICGWAGVMVLDCGPRSVTNSRIATRATAALLRPKTLAPCTTRGRRAISSSR